MSSEIIHHHRKGFLPAAGHDLFLPLYDPFVSLLGGDRARQKLIDQARLEPGQNILDVGCGTGTLVVLLKQQFPGVQVVGLDPDPRALRRARVKAKRSGVSVQLGQGFADELPYRDDSFDRVFSSFMFHHLEEEDREKTLKEIARVLKAGGSFQLLDFDGNDGGSHRGLGRLIHSSDRLKDNSEERILRLMRSAGFTIANKVKDGGMFFGLLRTAYYEATV